MDALEEAVDSGHGYPDGLYWFSKTGAPVFGRVHQLIDKARLSEIEAHLIESETFDELMGDLLVLEDKKDWPEKVLKRLDSHRPRLSNAPVPSHKGTWPVLRFNALCIESWPATCRLVKCDIGGQKEIYAGIEESEANVVAVRRQVGVLAFGRDSEVDKAFGNYKIDLRDLYTIQDYHLKSSYQEHNLIYQALSRAISRERPVYMHRKGSRRFVVADPASRGRSPKRVVVHKTTEFKSDEVKGCFDAFRATGEVDLIQVIKSAAWKGILIEEPTNGKKGQPARFPCDRGSFLSLTGRDALLWTQGNVPEAARGRNYYKEGKGIPTPLMLRRFAGHGTWDETCRATLGLTKMNWNNDSLYDRLPVTLEYSDALADVIKRFPAASNGLYEFRYFM